MAVAPRASWEQWRDQLPQLVVNQAWRHHRPPIPCFCASFRTRLLT
jgi:hypothetical protein